VSAAYARPVDFTSDLLAVWKGMSQIRFASESESELLALGFSHLRTLEPKPSVTSLALSDVVTAQRDCFSMLAMGNAANARLESEVISVLPPKCSRS
jgi:hypothetical protein